MKNITLILFLFFLFSCKEKTQSKTNIKSREYVFDYSKEKIDEVEHTEIFLNKEKYNIDKFLITISKEEFVQDSLSYKNDISAQNNVFTNYTLQTSYGQIKFVTNNSNSSDSSVNYSYLGFSESLKSHLINLDLYEGERTLIVSNQIYKKTIISGLPLFSLSRKYAVSYKDNEGLSSQISVYNVENFEIKNGKVEFKNVTFAYDGEHNVLNNISFTAYPGETVALVGHTGSGKSSIINILMRFYEFTEGDILIDGKSIKDYPMEEIREKMGLVLQDSFLFYGDIARNIRLMNENLPDLSVEKAAEFVHADHFIESLPGEYHAKVIERGASYSSGERQLISFARTIIRDPKILILDEATASIDTETELMIQQSMEKMRKGRTTIAIAHRLSTIRDAHLILVLEKGNIVERGTHEELIAMEGTYYDMYRLQSMND